MTNAIHSGGPGESPRTNSRMKSSPTAHSRSRSHPLSLGPILGERSTIPTRRIHENAAELARDSNNQDGSGKLDVGVIPRHGRAKSANSTGTGDGGSFGSLFKRTSRKILSNKGSITAGTTRLGERSGESGHSRSSSIRAEMRDEEKELYGSRSERSAVSSWNVGSSRRPRRLSGDLDMHCIETPLRTSSRVTPASKVQVQGHWNDSIDREDDWSPVRGSTEKDHSGSDTSTSNTHTPTTPGKGLKHPTATRTPDQPGHCVVDGQFDDANSAPPSASTSLVRGLNYLLDDPQSTFHPSSSFARRSSSLAGSPDVEHRDNRQSDVEPSDASAHPNNLSSTSPPDGPPRPPTVTTPSTSTAKGEKSRGDEPPQSPTSRARAIHFARQSTLRLGRTVARLTNSIDKSLHPFRSDTPVQARPSEGDSKPSDTTLVQESGDRGSIGDGVHGATPPGRLSQETPVGGNNPDLGACEGRQDGALPGAVGQCHGVTLQMSGGTDGRGDAGKCARTVIPTNADVDSSSLVVVETEQGAEVENIFSPNIPQEPIGRGIDGTLATRLTRRTNHSATISLADMFVSPTVPSGLNTSNLTSEQKLGASASSDDRLPSTGLAPGIDMRETFPTPVLPHSAFPSPIIAHDGWATRGSSCALSSSRTPALRHVEMGGTALQSVGSAQRDDKGKEPHDEEQKPNLTSLSPPALPALRTVSCPTMIPSVDPNTPANTKSDSTIEMSESAPAHTKKPIPGLSPPRPAVPIRSCSTSDPRASGGNSGNGSAGNSGTSSPSSRTTSRIIARRYSPGIGATPFPAPLSFTLGHARVSYVDDRGDMCVSGGGTGVASASASASGLPGSSGGLGTGIGNVGTGLGYHTPVPPSLFPGLEMTLISRRNSSCSCRGTERGDNGDGDGDDDDDVDVDGGDERGKDGVTGEPSEDSGRKNAGASAGFGCDEKRSKPVGDDGRLGVDAFAVCADCVAGVDVLGRQTSVTNRTSSTSTSPATVRPTGSIGASRSASSSESASTSVPTSALASPAKSTFHISRTTSLSRTRAFPPAGSAILHGMSESELDELIRTKVRERTRISVTPGTERMGGMVGMGGTGGTVGGNGTGVGFKSVTRGPSLRRAGDGKGM